MLRFLLLPLLLGLLLSCVQSEEYFAVPSAAELSSSASSSSGMVALSSSADAPLSSSSWAEPASSSAGGSGSSSSFVGLPLSSSSEPLVPPQTLSSSNAVPVVSSSSASPSSSSSSAGTLKNSQACLYEQSSSSSLAAGTLACEGRVYSTVLYNYDVWMTENLEVVPAEGNSWCYQGDTNCGGLGRLYDWKAANWACPAAWHLPTDEDWQRLEQYLGMHWDALALWGYTRGTVQGDMVKVTDGSWSEGSGTDVAHFHALPAGQFSSGTINNVGVKAEFWTATPYSEGRAIYRTLVASQSTIGRFSQSVAEGASVRCVMDR